MTTPTRPRHTFGRRGTGTPQKVRIVAAVPVARPKTPIASATVVPDGRVIRTPKASVWNKTLTSCRAVLGDGLGSIKAAAAAAVERNKAAAADRRERRILAAEARAALAAETRAAKDERARVAASVAASQINSAKTPTVNLLADAPTAMPDEAPHWADTARAALYASFPFASSPREPAPDRVPSPDVLADRRAVEELMSYDAPVQRSSAAPHMCELAATVLARNFASKASVTDDAAEAAHASGLLMADAGIDVANPGNDRHDAPSSPDPEAGEHVEPANQADDSGRSPPELPTFANDDATLENDPEAGSSDYDADLADLEFDADYALGDQLEETGHETLADDTPAAAPSNDWLWGRAYFLASAIAIPAGLALAKLAGAADNAIAQLGTVPLIAVIALSPLWSFVAFLPAAGLMWLTTRLHLPRVLRALTTGGALGASWALLSLWDGKSPPAGAYGFIVAGLLGGLIFWLTYTPPTPSADASEASVAASE